MVSAQVSHASTGRGGVRKCFICTRCHAASIIESNSTTPAQKKTSNFSHREGGQDIIRLSGQRVEYNV